MSCYLLTGATGLLGTYLVKDVLQAGSQLALIVRSTRIKSAEERVERIRDHWARQGVSLPEVTVFDGDITEPNLGLSQDAQKWVAANCTGFIHSAASLKFRESHGEPWRSNVKGTDHAVRLAEKIQVPEFHYISTAYVCGKTDEPAYELPIPSTVSPRNVYEESKCQAERRVLHADLPQPATICRPSIIIGDSQNGYTTTFHGVYLPLRQAAALIATGVGNGPPPIIDPVRIMQIMGLKGQETKDLVPVDWVSRNISRIVHSPEFHGGIYHLTANEPSSVQLVNRMTVECLLQALGLNVDEVQLEGASSPETDEMFCQLLSVYREYWEDDPKFDRTGISMVAPDDPSPPITREMLMRTFNYALEAMLEKPGMLTSGPVVGSAE